MKRSSLTVISVAVLTACGAVACSIENSDSPTPGGVSTEGEESGAGESQREAAPASQAAQRSADGEWSNSTGMRFRVVPAGDLDFEAPRDGPLDQLSPREQFMRRERGEPPLPPGFHRPVRISRPFSISVCEVTHAEFHMLSGRGALDPAEPSRPVGVSWDEAAEFCRQLSELPEEKEARREYRLPTQAEWQLAAPGGGDDCYPWHLTPEHVSVWNWCLDLFDPEYYRALPKDTPTLDPKGAETGSSHVVMCSYSHPDPFRRLMAFRVVVESPGFAGEALQE